MDTNNETVEALAHLAARQQGTKILTLEEELTNGLDKIAKAITEMSQRSRADADEIVAALDGVMAAIVDPDRKIEVTLSAEAIKALEGLKIQ